MNAPVHHDPNKEIDRGFTSRLTFGHFADGAHHHFDEAHALFGRYFKHDDGQPYVSASAFRQLLALNHDPAYQAKWGPVRSQWTYAIEPTTQRIIAGSTYVAMMLPPALARQADIDVLYLGGTLFVDDAYRGHGLALTLVDQREKAVCAYAAEHGARGGNAAAIKLLAINEQNDPRKMTLAEIEEDIRVSGIHPCDRMISTRRTSNWRTIDPRFDYVEVGEADGPGVTYMTLGVKAAGRSPPPAAIPAEVLCHFLRTYGGRRKLGSDPDQDAVLQQQLAAARALGTLRPVDDSAELEQLRERIETLRSSPSPAVAFTSTQVCPRQPLPSPGPSTGAKLSAD
jgi:GNAT superfamily N-acetyltransferase